MVSIAEFTLPAAEFPLGPVFDTCPGARLELDRVVPSGDTVMPHFWVIAPDCDLAAILAVFEALPELRTAVLMEDLGERGLYRAEWKPEFMGIMAAIEAAELTVVSARGSREGWTFELRAESVDQLSAFREYCEEHGVPATLDRLQRLTETTTGTEFELTPAQREALVLAYEEGYFDDPRQIDQEALASELGISRQALSARLRRGYRNLVEVTLVHRGEE